MAEEFARIKRNTLARIAVIGMVILAAGGLGYKRIADPRIASEAFDAGVRLMAAANYDQAALDFSRVIAIRPDFADAYRMRGRLSMAKYSPAAAIRDFTKAIQLDPRDASALVDRGLAYLDEDKPDYSAAITDADRAVDLDPKLARAYNLRGTAKRAAGKPDEAIEDFTRAIRLHPSLESLVQRATTYQLVDQHELAIEDFTNALIIDPQSSPVYFARALSEAAIGDSAAAKLDADTGLKIEGE